MKKLVYLFVLPWLTLVLFACRHKEIIAYDEPNTNTIKLSDAQIQLANINVAELSIGSIGRKLSLTGVLRVNEQTSITISSRVQGRIEKLFFRNTGETVRKGDKLYEFYSEDLVSAQREYFTLQSNNWNFSGKYEPSLALENKLLIMGMLPSQIQQLGKDGKVLFRVTIYSPASGKIRTINISEGQYAYAGQSLFELAEDNSLWMEAQVYPDEIKYLKAGMIADVVIPSAEGMIIRCRINFINPAYEEGKNITLVRVNIDNTEHKLHPGMFALLNVQTPAIRGLIIPSSALLSGSDNERIWIRDENGEFSFRTVTTGQQAGDSILVLSGLDNVEEIVTSGAYLLNSELILKQGIRSGQEIEYFEKSPDKKAIETSEN